LLRLQPGELASFSLLPPLRAPRLRLGGRVDAALLAIVAAHSRRVRLRQAAPGSVPGSTGAACYTPVCALS